MAKTIIDTTSLIAHLQVAAARYDESAYTAGDCVHDEERTKARFHRQATECRDWIDAIRSMSHISRASPLQIELVHAENFDILNN